MHQDFTVFFTSDIHGRDIQSARLFSIYKKERSAAESEGRFCLFLDAGDPSDRSIDYCGLTKCSGYSHVLNAFRYDALTVGNDVGLPYGTTALKTFLSRIQAPVLGSNYRNGNGPVIPGLEERVLLTCGKLKIGIFGLTNSWNGAYESSGLKFPPSSECAAEQIKALKNQGAEVILMLSHMGLAGDLEIAMTNPEIDLVAGGHSHTKTVGGVYDNRGTLYHHCGEFAEYLGRIGFRYDFSSGKITERSASLVEIPVETEPAQEILEAIEEARKEAAEIGSEIIGASQFTLELNYWEECSFGKFSADALKEYGEADIAILATGNLNGELESGPVTAAQLNSACFGASNPCVSVMQGKFLRESLERGLDEELNRIYHHGLRGAPVGIPQISGIEVEAELKADKGKRIKEVKFEGNPLDDERFYRVAHTDLEMSRRLGFFPHHGYSLESNECDVILRDILEKKIRSETTIRNPIEKRWSFY